MANHVGPPMPPLTRPLVPPTSLLPTVATLSAFISSHLPQRPHEREVPFFYHVPRSRNFNANNAPVQRMVFSLTPTLGIYGALGSARDEGAAANGVGIGSKQGCTMAFLHRPWGLDRARVPKGSTVLSSHKGFDEVLTVGANCELAGRLGMRLDVCRDVKEVQDAQPGQGGGEGNAVNSEVADGGVGNGTALVLKGYKNDPERKIGVVAKLTASELSWDEIRESVAREFGGMEKLAGCFGFPNVEGTKPPAASATADEDSIDDEEDGGVSLTSPAPVPAPTIPPTPVRGIAIMNAFHPAEVLRVAQAALSLSLIPSLDECSGIIYLTGAVREEGLKAALERGMKVVCVGHEGCEKWGLEFLKRRVEDTFPGVEVVVVDEEEIKPEKSEKKRKGGSGETGKAEGECQEDRNGKGEKP